MYQINCWLWCCMFYYFSYIISKFSLILEPISFNMLFWPFNFGMIPVVRETLLKKFKATLAKLTIFGPRLNIRSMCSPISHMISSLQMCKFQKWCASFGVLFCLRVLQQHTRVFLVYTILHGWFWTFYYVCKNWRRLKMFVCSQLVVSKYLHE